MNLLQETLGVLEDEGIVPRLDVLYVMTGDSWGTWDDFTKLANIDYDAGFGSQEINSSLCIVGKDWWLERSEYDGAEGWEYKSLPNRPIIYNPNLNLKES